MKWIILILCSLFASVLVCQDIYYTEGNEAIIPDELKIDDIYSIETTWIYETRDHPASFIGFQEYIIVDTLMWKGKNSFVIEPGLESDRDYMFVEDNKIYFWDDNLQDFQLNYDFDNDSTYYIKFRNWNNQVDSTIVYIDSIVTRNINGIDHTVQHCRSTMGIYHSFFIEIEIISNIGANFGGLRLPIGYVIDNITNDKQRLRCLNNHNLSLNFTEVVCDSTWVTTSSLDFNAKQIHIYPNPTNNKIYIDGIEGEIDFELYSLTGILLEQSKTSNKSISLDRNGIFLLRIRNGRNLVTRKIIKIE